MLLRRRGGRSGWVDCPRRERGGGEQSTQEEYLVVSFSNIPFFFTFLGKSVGAA